MQFDLPLDVPPRRSRKIVRELHRQMREAIISGRLAQGVQLPPTRVFAEQYGVSRSTASSVYELLIAEGFLDTRQGAGTFVAKHRKPSASAKKNGSRDIRRLSFVRNFPARGEFSNSSTKKYLFDLRLGIPEKNEFPFGVWRRLSNRELRRFAKTPSTYHDPAGPIEFREAISAHISNTRAVGCSANNTIATTGAQQAFYLLARTLVEPGKTIVAVEDPGYPPIHAAFIAAGARVVPVPVDKDGIIVELVPETANVVCVTPTHQFPTGAVMSLQRRYDLLEFARKSKAIIIEDDYDSEFRYEGRPLDALQTLDRDASVFYVGTFSKTIFPELRLGFLVAPNWAHDAIVNIKRVVDCHGPILPQLTLSAFITEGHLARHVRRMRKVYKSRRAVLLEKLADTKWLEPIPSSAGLHISALLREDIPIAALVNSCANNNIAIETLQRFSFESRTPGITFGFGICEKARISEAISIIAEIGSQLLQGKSKA